MSLLSGDCEICYQPVVHRHKRTTYVAATDGDSIFICRACDENSVCDDCGPDSALHLYEQKHGGSTADNLAPEAMVTAIFAIEFAEWFLAYSPQYNSLLKAYNAAYRSDLRKAVAEFAATRGKHEGDHKFSPDYMPCVKCDEAYIAAEAKLDAALRLAQGEK